MEGCGHPPVLEPEWGKLVELSCPVPKSRDLASWAVPPVPHRDEDKDSEIVVSGALQLL